MVSIETKLRQIQHCIDEMKKTENYHVGDALTLIIEVLEEISEQLSEQPIEVFIFGWAI